LFDARCNHEVYWDELAVTLQMSVISVHDLFHKELGISKVCRQGSHISWYIKWNRSAFRHAKLDCPAMKHKVMIPFEKLQAKCCECVVTILEANKLAERSVILQWQNLKVLNNIICWSCYIDCLVGYEECHMSSTDLLQKESTMISIHTGSSWWRVFWSLPLGENNAYCYQEVWVCSMTMHIYITLGKELQKWKNLQ